MVSENNLLGIGLILWIKDEKMMTEYNRVSDLCHFIKENSKSKENSSQEENFLNENADGDVGSCVVLECHVGHTNSRAKIAQKQPRIYSTEKPGSVCCLLLLVKCLDLLINICIIGLNSLDFQIRKHLKWSLLDREAIILIFIQLLIIHKVSNVHKMTKAIHLKTAG